MMWYSKEQQTPFDTTPIVGLHYLIGDLLAQTYHTESVRGKKYPLVAFSSEIKFDVFVADDERSFISLDNPLKLLPNATCDEAFSYAESIAQNSDDLAVFKLSENQIVIMNFDTHQHLLVTYDNEARLLLDVDYLENAPKSPKPPPIELLDEETRQRLPNLDSIEALGLQAIAYVKFVGHDQSWIWYISAFDGDSILYGLYIGRTIRFGYGYLSELTGEDSYYFGPPADRDDTFQPTTLAILLAKHEQERRQ